MDLEDLDFIASMARELLAIDEGYKAEYDEFTNIIHREIKPLFIALGVRD